jgi:hypothetical protein
VAVDLLIVLCLDAVENVDSLDAMEAVVSAFVVVAVVSLGVAPDAVTVNSINEVTISL